MFIIYNSKTMVLLLCKLDLIIYEYLEESFLVLRSQLIFTTV